MIRYIITQLTWLLLLVAAVAAFYLEMYWLGGLALLGLACLLAGVFSVRLSMYCKNKNKLRTTDKYVALTFDDAPTENTEKVLEILRSKGARATFFCIGKYAEEHPEMVQRIVAEGHAVGSHTQHHKISYTFKGIRAVKRELREGMESVSAAAGKPTRLFRLPFGVSNPVIGYCVRKLNLISVGWSVRSFDTTAKNIPRLRNKILRRVKNGRIILFHDYSPATLTMLPWLIDGIQYRGFYLVPLKEDNQ